jgi:hypothetical protein
MNKVHPVREGQVLTGPLFNEPMRVETVHDNGKEAWSVGLVGTQSERFRKVTLTGRDLESLTILDAGFSYNGDGFSGLAFRPILSASPDECIELLRIVQIPKPPVQISFERSARDIIPARISHKGSVASLTRGGVKGCWMRRFASVVREESKEAIPIYAQHKLEP